MVRMRSPVQSRSGAPYNEFMIIQQLRTTYPDLTIKTQGLDGYQYDASSQTGVLPLAAVVVKTYEDVKDLINFANEHTLALVCRGAGSGKVGGGLV